MLFRSLAAAGAFALLLPAFAAAQEAPEGEAAETPAPETLPAGDAGAQQGGGGDLAKQIANPVSSLISVPFQQNIDCCFGPNEVSRYTLNIQPVVPVSLGSDFQVIVRTILPFVSQRSPAPGVRGGTDFGDITQSFFFKPKDTGGIIWGVGPALLWPVGGSGFGSGKFGAGPTGLLLKQTPSGLTMGLLANHIWSYAGDSDRDNISSTFIQPFFSKTFKDTSSVTINSETSYDWVHDQWTVPVNLVLGRVYKFGKQPVQYSFGGRYYAVSPENGPTWGVRATITLLFPK